MALFTIAEDVGHHVGNRTCPECLEGYPERCKCGGLIHAAVGDEDTEGNVALTTACDRCGRSEEDQAP